MNAASGPRFHSGPVLLVAVLIVVAMEIFFVGIDLATLKNHGYLGPDSYMRMLRVEKLIGTGDWFDRISDRTNAPYGELLPWGRPLDAVLVAIAAVLSMFTDTKAAVYWAGVALGPLLAFVMISVLSWGTRPFLGGGTFLMMFVLLPLCFALAFNLHAARADHHGFLALLFLVQLCAAFRLAAGASGRAAALLIGLVGGLMVWVSIMALLVQLVLTLALAMHFLRTGRAGARYIFLYTAGLVLGFSVALPLERGMAGLPGVDVNKLSVAHWMMAVVAAACWWGIDRYLRRAPREPSPGARLAALLAGGAIPVAVTGLLFPEIFRGPTGAYDADVVAFYFDNITEFQPLLPKDTRTLAIFLGHFGPVFVALGFIAWDYRRAAAGVRAVYDTILAGLLVYIPMALWVARFIIEVEVLILVPWAMSLAAIMTWTRTVAVAGRRMPVRGFAVVAAMTGPLLLSAGILALAPQPKSSATPAEWVSMSRFLARYAEETSSAAQRPQILLSYITRGPELAWRTPYSVVGAPYANVDSLRYTAAVFLSTSESEARAQFRRRGIELFLFSVSDSENRMYLRGTADNFLRRISQDRAPGWLVPVPLPEALSERFRLYRVVRG